MFRKIILLSTVFLTGCIAIFTSDNPGNSMLHTDRRTTAAVLMDASLESELNRKLTELALNDESRIYLKSFNRHIIVLGQTPNQENIEKISSLLANTEGVKKIYNELTSTKSINVWQQAQDQWITAKIKSSMLVTPHINPFKVHIVTENNTVYLIGVVKPEEEEVIVNIAKKTTGVQKVVKIFEYKKQIS